jgi:hypothetical protein
MPGQSPVEYDTHPDGSLRIYLTSYDPPVRFLGYPKPIRDSVVVEQYLNPTLDEARKIKVATGLGQQVLDAVMDDIYCERAERQLARERSRVAYDPHHEDERESWR